MVKLASIDPRCLIMSLIPSSIEIYNRETNGYLIGGNGGNRIRIVSAYYTQTDRKKPSYVEHGNFSAIKRVENFIKTLNLSLIGGFHSHPGGPNKLSKSDIKYISEVVEDHMLKNWLELVITVKKREYSTKHKPSWNIKKYGKKIGFLVKNGYTGYNITLSGFLLKRKEDKIMQAGEVALCIGRTTRI